MVKGKNELNIISKKFFYVFLVSMIINFTPESKYKQNTFTSRNATIRRADDIARLVNRQYPRISSTNIEDFKNINKHPEVFNRLANLINRVRFNMKTNMNKSEDNISKLKAFAEVVSDYKVGNCDESAKLAYIAAQANGLKDLQLAALETIAFNPVDQTVQCVKSLDHLVLRVENNKKPYIIDPWLGFADYLPKAMQRYRSEFGHHFNFSSNPKDIAVVSPKATIFGLLVNNIPQSDLQKEFPQLILPEPQKPTLVSKIKKMFKNIF